MEEYLCFLQNHYEASVRRMITNNERRIIIDLARFRDHLPSKNKALFQQYREEEVLLKLALKQVVEKINPEYSNRYEEFFVGFEGSFGSHHVTPQTLNSNFINKLVCVEGVVARCHVVRSKLVKCVYFCPTTGKTMIVRSAVQPKMKDWELQYGLCEYKDVQEITIREAYENTSPGRVAREVIVSCEYDLADSFKIGERVLVVGVRRHTMPGVG
ncbi:DNA replication licensing factor MCM3-like [Myzus persicae]|uniref:DNA replication licensing factor MCM3-like n=1 Tax=Myzus persicae TaxID=13164 RepID=UPI000B934C76|nr:DNA replication licensing factor MCM3-like [Myzus persicae]